ncbi:unnamed protein product [Clavelina lepadiformis]|uniref:N-acetyltransferase domain-containing protein n=1 Tax=Clavelina lepadiformis TaxID=159417 RepID=A0ABP0FC48_CLALP
MSDVEQVDVTTTEEDLSTSANLSTCAYCGCQKDGVLIFYCNHCHRWVHTSCLHAGPPSSLLADNYYTFKCVSCSSDGKESFERMKLTWVQVVSVALYNLAQTCLGKQGYFKWKEDICLFIDKNWDIFFGDRPQKAQWSCTVGSILSTGNPHRFLSGYGMFKDAGWWRLTDPTQAPEYSPGTPIVPKPHVTSAKKRRSHFGFRSSARKRSQLNLTQQAAENKAKQALVKENISDDGRIDSPLSSTITENSIPSPASSYSSDSKSSGRKEPRLDPILPLVAISDDESEAENLLDNGVKRKQAKEASEPNADFRDSKVIVTDKDFEKSNTAKEKSRDENNSKNKLIVTQPQESVVKMMSLYEEQKLLKKLLSLPSTDANLDARRLKRKLLLRRKKRELGQPVFNFDDTVRQLCAKEKNAAFDPISNDTLVSALPHATSQGYRILDRFLSSDSKVYQAEECDKTFRQKLIGSDENKSDMQMLVSPYTQRMLKPFIRRDFETKPTKLKVLEEIISRYNRNDLSWKPSPSFPIDYCYVRPRHIPAINAMCRHFFWPGVDLSESLQYPDFSVVALYKKMVIGFGFLVPDISFNQSYLSFLLVHPDWQRAGIGTFMLYHLIQTCLGKDITLHVSASNSAMLLYQRFGFKPERFEADFYDKYMPPDTIECTHAFFMRLRR